MPNGMSQDLIQILEEAACAGTPLVVEMYDGRRFADGVIDVHRLCGEDFVVFHANNRHAVRDIVRAELLHCQEGDDLESRDGVDHAWSVL
jgi:hypothetical protein